MNGVAFRIDPTDDVDEIRDEAGYGAFHQGIVAVNNGFFEYINFVGLTNDWNE